MGALAEAVRNQGASRNRIRGGPLNKTIRISKELPRMASTIKMPPKQQTNEEVVESGQDKAARSCTVT